MDIGRFPLPFRGVVLLERIVMSQCADCQARRKMAREAFAKAEFAKATGQVLKGAAEVLGLKDKTGAQEARNRNVGIAGQTTDQEKK